MSGLEISKNDVYETGLKYDYVKEKLENHKDLKDLYGQVLGLDGKEKKKIEDLSGVKTYLDSIKDKSWNDIKQEGATWSFAVQLFLKSQNLYDGKIDGLYMTAGHPESKTRAAVKKFQETNGLVVDGRAGSETIKKMIEKIDVKPAAPELDMNKIVENKEIIDAYKKLNPIFQGQFRTGGYVIETKEYSYKIVDKQLQRTNKPVGPMVIIEEILLADGKWGKKETPVNVPTNKLSEGGADKKGQNMGDKGDKIEKNDSEKTNKALLELKISGLDFNGLGADEKKSKEYFLGKIISVLGELNLSLSDLTSENINGLFVSLRKEKVIGSILGGSSYQDNIDYGITKTNFISAESTQKKKMEQNQKVENLIKDYFSKIVLEK